MASALTTITTARGVDVEVRQAGSGPDILYLHGLVGLLESEPMLDALSRDFTVHAPVWPGYGPLENEGSIEDMLDFALLGWDIADGLELRQPHLVGHSMGAMIAAEMACLARRDLNHLVLLAPYGLWLDDHPLPDPFGVLPFNLVELLLADPAHADALAAEGVDLESDEGLATFMVANTRRLGTAGKIMFPIPNRRLAKRLYRLSAPTLVVMAADDQLVTPAYGPAWVAAIDHAELHHVAGTGHLLNVEAPTVTAEVINRFLNSH